MTHLYNGMSTTAGDLLYPNPGRLLPGMTSVNGEFQVPRHVLRPDSIVIRDSVRHPRRVRYQVPAKYRAVAHALAHRGTTLTGFGALALYGLPHLVDAHDTVLISPTLHAKKRGSTFEPALVRKQLEPEELWQMECRGELITVVAPPVAVVQALQLIRSRQCAWPVLASEDEEAFVRAVQLVDASRRFLALTPEAIAVAGKGRVNNRWLASVLKASSALAESPKETEMRLIAQEVARQFGLKLEEQVEFWANGKLVTRADLAFPEARIALYYDGRHHDDAQNLTWGFAREFRADCQLLRAVAYRRASAHLRYTSATTAANPSLESDSGESATTASERAVVAASTESNTATPWSRAPGTAAQAARAANERTWQPWKEQYSSAMARSCSGEKPLIRAPAGCAIPFRNRTG